MKVLVTGASGYLGSALVEMLAGHGTEVVALSRSGAIPALAGLTGVEVVKGDIEDLQSLKTAINGCKQVYHLAGKVGAWAPDNSSFYKVNVEGTRNVLEAATEKGVQRVLFTSSAGVLGPALENPTNEDEERKISYKIPYDHSKKIAEDLVLEYSRRGMDSVIVMPSKVYGPGLVSHSLTANAIINTFLKKRVAFISGPGDYKVNFAFVDDVVKGHILAMTKGRSGERYILGGTNISYFDFFNKIRIFSKRSAHIYKLPKRLIKLAAQLQEINHKLTGMAVMFPANSVDHLFSNYIFSSGKAINELGYKITPLAQALSMTIEYLNHNHE